ncbi:(d)CMP kinase [Candidatus Pelagibacter sp.]|nr:(d)CMP kinase [Candidatus Pelagibacter sp.]
MKKRKNLITVAIDSPAAAGAGSQAKLIAKHYNLQHLDTGRIYRLIGKLKLTNNKNFSYSLIKKKIKNLKIKDLQNKNLLSDKVATSASIIAKDKTIRKIVHNFQLECAYRPPKKFSGSVLDGRDITSVVMKTAMFKFFITANIKTRAQRRYKELKPKNKTLTYQEVLKSIKKRDKSDYNRKISPLKKTKDSVLINSTNHGISSCFLKIKQIMDRKIKA